MDHTLEQYKTLFDEDGKFKHSLFNQEMPKEEFEVVEETESGSGDQEEEEEFNHIKTPLYTIKLQSSYEVLADSDLDISHIYSTFLLPMNVNDSLCLQISPVFCKYHLCLANVIIFSRASNKPSRSCILYNC